jgi:sulfite oxidase
MLPSEQAKTLVTHTREPLNGGPRLQDLVRSFLTPVPLFFVRTHGAIPKMPSASYRLMIDGLVRHPLALSLDDLRARYTREMVTATLQCAGNRRSELIQIAPIPDEIPWGPEAISTASWSGYPLADILADAGVLPEASHVAFTGGDQIEQHREIISFGASIPLAKAQSPEVILADKMNETPLSPVHGAPLRVIVPGYIGARSVKWLSRITLQDQPSDNFYQARAYRHFAPDVTSESADWKAAPMLEIVPVNAAICVVHKSLQARGKSILLRGYALGTGMAPIERVEITADGGRHWMPARLLPEQAPWAWRLWETELPLEAESCSLVVRAHDTLQHTQPESLAAVWNFKGYLNNAWHAVNV